MNKPSIRSIIAEILNCEPEQLNQDSALGVTAGWDSFNYLNMLLELEKHYQIDINEETVNQYRTFSAMLELE